MSAVIHSPAHSDRSLLAASFALFAVAGGITTPTDSLVLTAAGTALAIGGVYSASRFAASISRKRLATVSIALWSSFLAVAGLHVLEPGSIAAAAPESIAIPTIALSAITWATLLSACSTTVFLAFREYGATPGTEDAVVENDSDYSVR
ncbi:hypothetical protein HALLA_10520 [Halostagnicola larsenii XH-48]|uniref:Uncharacterized protein n=1 Tax=Halostagnicola larsenii XH-48 TaxID=797299 RepID=W0JKF4_9EURY|nr:hypothetical protein [Halostagnicola larsenii]AHF99220.1 hypothetical protein HALLA_10520 [Halostagnicola larsenii XH-48]